MNRYSDYSVSAYDPMSFQDIAAVPLMKRQQHDANQAKLDAYLTEINKIDPLDVHQEEAMRIKSDLANKINQQSEQLAKEGFNNNTVPNVLKTNREIQDLFSPTGRAGQINQAKITEAAEYKKFIDSPELKDYGLDAKEKAWQKHRAEYLGYDKNNNIVNIKSLSGPRYEDMHKDFMDLSGRLGESTKTYLNNVGAHFVQGPYGGLIMVSADGKTINTDNDSNLKALAETMSSKYVNPQGEGYKSREFAGYDIKNTIDQLNGMLGIPRVDKEVKDLNYNYNFINDPNAKTSGTEELSTPDATFDNTSTVNLEKDVKDLDFSDIGTKQYAGPVKGESSLMGSEGTSTFKNRKTTYKDIMSPLQQKLYETSYNRLVKKGKIKEGADMSDPKVASIVGFYMKNHLKVPTIGNDVIRPDISPDSQLFMGELANKDANQRNATLEQDIRGDEDNPSFREMVDAKTGQKVKLDIGEKIEYIGYDSPINYRGYNFNNKWEQNVSAHKAQVLDKNGNFVRNVAIGRTKNEMSTPEFKSMYEINHVYRKAVEHLGEWQQPTGKYSGSKQIKDYLIKYNDDGTFTMYHKSTKESETMDVPTFQKNMRQILSY